MVRQKPGCTATEDVWRLEISDLGSRNCTIGVAKTKARISFAVIAKLICVFVFGYPKCWFSHDVAHMYFEEECFQMLQPNVCIAHLQDSITKGCNFD